MRFALDRFEIDGVGHNLPFLSAVMDHPRFIKGNITTAFIAEEYPEGFKGVTLKECSLKAVAATCAAMNRVAEIRRTKISGRLDNHERKVGDDWVINLQETSFVVHVLADQEGSDVVFEDGKAVRVSGNWTPGQSLAEMIVDGKSLIMKIVEIPCGFHIQNRGADLRVYVRTPLQAKLAKLMPEKLAYDNSNILACPMPGILVKLDVEVGAEVQEGDALCIVEAMKMENILRAERQGIISKINFDVGDSLAVEDVILEFES